MRISGYQRPVQSNKDSLFLFSPIFSPWVDDGITNGRIYKTVRDAVFRVQKLVAEGRLPLPIEQCGELDFLTHTEEVIFSHLRPYARDAADVKSTGNTKQVFGDNNQV